jgi:hypothetical protein
MLKRYLFFAIVNLGLVLARVITKDTVDSGLIDLSIGDIVITDNVYWSIINNAISSFTGTLQVGSGSGFYITSHNSLIALTVTLFGVLNSIENKGIISFNSVRSFTAPIYTLAGNFG